MTTRLEPWLCDESLAEQLHAVIGIVHSGDNGFSVGAALTEFTPASADLSLWSSSAALDGAP